MNTLPEGWKKHATDDGTWYDKHGAPNIQIGGSDFQYTDAFKKQSHVITGKFNLVNVGAGTPPAIQFDTLEDAIAVAEIMQSQLGET